MRIMSRCMDTWREGDSLREALKLPVKAPLILSLVGGGGKTSVMYRLAAEYARDGKRVIVTTSTHIAYPPGYRVLLTESAKEVEGTAFQDGILVVGRPVYSPHEESPVKLKGMEPEEITKLSEYADVLLIEADGAKRLPLKVPASHEPVIIPATDLVIACCGLDSIGQPLSTACFRWELAGELLGVSKEHLITSTDAARILTAQWGAKKHTEGMEYRIVLNKADTKERVAIGIDLYKELERISKENTIITSFLDS